MDLLIILGTAALVGLFMVAVSQSEVKRRERLAYRQGFQDAKRDKI